MEVCVATKKAVRAWSQLPIEILEAIFIQLPLLDYFYAGAVCVSWHEAAVAAYNRRHYPRTPWLMFSQDPETNTHSFLCLDHDNKVYNLHLPMVHNQEAQYLGSFQEWLILKNSTKAEFFLLNIISKARLQLPRNAQLHHPPKWYFAMSFSLLVEVTHEGILSSSPTSDDCTVVMLLGGNQLAFCSLGDAAWTVFDPLEAEFENPLIMSMSFHGGYLHCICDGYQHVVCELNVPPTCEVLDACPLLQIADHDRDHIRRDGIRLVESDSDLLMVLKLTSHCLENYVDDYSKTLGFYVFKMDASDFTTDWVKVDSLGDGMLFLGDKGSNSFWAKDLSGFRGNHIYFTKNRVHYLPSKCDAAVFSLKDHTIKTFISERVSLPLMWFMM